MSKKHSSLSIALLLIFTLSMLGGALAAPSTQALAAPVYDGYALVDAVNQFRAANGLYPYQVDGYLAAAAQVHSDYQASLGYWTHAGADGSDEAQRAAGWGYGSGARIMCDEAVAFGLDYSPQQALEKWMDGEHLAIMLSTRYVHAGGGATVDAQGRVFYTLDVCYLPDQPKANPVTNVGSNSVPAAATEQPFSWVQTVTPQPDGQIVHVIQDGQTLTMIADAYGISLQELLTLNNLNPEGMLRVGDKLIIRLAFTPTVTSPPTSTPTPIIPTSTRRPTRTPTPVPAVAAALPDTPSPTGTAPALGALSNMGGDWVGRLLLILVGGLAVVGVALVAVGLLLKRP